MSNYQKYCLRDNIKTYVIVFFILAAIMFANFAKSQEFKFAGSHNTGMQVFIDVPKEVNVEFIDSHGHHIDQVVGKSLVLLPIGSYSVVMTSKDLIFITYLNLVKECEEAMVAWRKTPSYSVSVTQKL